MDNEGKKRPERRQYFRQQYPQAKQPMLEIEGKTFPVLDICERGVKIEAVHSMAFVEGATIDVTIRFAEEERLSLSGKIIHMKGSHVGILLSEAIRLADFFRD